MRMRVGDILVATRLGSVIRDGRNLTQCKKKDLREQIRMTQWESRSRKLLRSVLGKHQIGVKQMSVLGGKLPWRPGKLR